MHSLPKYFVNRQVLFQLVEELAEIHELQDFLELSQCMSDRGYSRELEGAIALQDTAYRRSIMRSWLEGNHAILAVPLAEAFIPVNLRKVS